jgi:hypothetical protein
MPDRRLPKKRSRRRLLEISTVQTVVGIVWTVDGTVWTVVSGADRCCKALKAVVV